MFGYVFCICAQKQGWCFVMSVCITAIGLYLDVFAHLSRSNDQVNDQDTDQDDNTVILKKQTAQDHS